MIKTLAQTKQNKTNLKNFKIYFRLFSSVFIITILFLLIIPNAIANEKVNVTIFINSNTTNISHLNSINSENIQKTNFLPIIFIILSVIFSFIIIFDRKVFKLI